MPSLIKTHIVLFIFGLSLFSASALSASAASRPLLSSDEKGRSSLVVVRKDDIPDMDHFVASINGKEVMGLRITKTTKIIDYLTPENWQSTRKKFYDNDLSDSWSALSASQKILYFAIDQYRGLTEGLLSCFKSSSETDPAKYLQKNTNRFTLSKIVESFKQIKVKYRTEEALDHKVAELERRAVPTVSASDEGSEAPEEPAAAASASSADPAAGSSS